MRRSIYGSMDNHSAFCSCCSSRLTDFVCQNYTVSIEKHCINYMVFIYVPCLFVSPNRTFCSCDCPSFIPLSSLIPIVINLGGLQSFSLFLHHFKTNCFLFSYQACVRPVRFSLPSHHSSILTHWQIFSSDPKHQSLHLWEILSDVSVLKHGAVCWQYIQSFVVLVLNMWDFLRLSRLFDTVEPLNDSCISLHSWDAIRYTLPCLLFLVLLRVWQSIIGGSPWPVAVGGDHRGRSEVQADDIRVSPGKVLWTDRLQLFRIKAAVVKKAFHVSSSPGIPVWQVWFRSV